jgi:hypothetical protein
MLACLLIAGLLNLCNFILVAAIWSLLPKREMPSPFASAIGALVGGAAGALLARPQLEFFVRQLGYFQEAGELAIGFALPFSLPITVGLAAWLVGDAAGGVTASARRAAATSCAGAVAGAGLVYLPLFFVSDPPRFITYPVLLAFPVTGSLLARLIENRRTRNRAG